MNIYEQYGPDRKKLGNTDQERKSRDVLDKKNVFGWNRPQELSKRKTQANET
jgi:hypothetical protein